MIAVKSCKQADENNGKPLVAVSILPQKFFLEKIAGDMFTIDVMLPPGVSPATYDPTPRQIKRLTESEFYFKIGHLAFEENLIDRKLKESHEVKQVNLSSDLELFEAGESSHGHSHHVDPHTWMSPRNVKTMVRAITKSLSDAYPQKDSLFRQNAEGFIREIDSIDRWISKVLKEVTHRRFIIYHPALTYYAKDYRLEQIPMEWEGKEPSPAYLKKLIQYADDEDVKAILVQKQFNIAEAETLGRETGARLISIDPLSYHWTDEIKHITEELALTLK